MFRHSTYDRSLRPLVIAHRGASGLYPENTLPAIIAATRERADLIEIDVRLTKDRHIVLLHDPTVERTTNGAGRVRAMTLTQVKSLDAGFTFTRDNGRSYPFAGKGVQIHLLAEVLTELPNVSFQIELKDNDFALAESVLNAVKMHNALRRIQLATASTRIAQFVRFLEPQACIAHTAIDLLKFVLCTAVCRPYEPCFHAGFIDLPLCLFRNQRLVSRAIKLAAMHDLRVRAYTVNDLDRIKQLVHFGVAGIFTDYPGQARQLLDELLKDTNQP